MALPPTKADMWPGATPEAPVVPVAATTTVNVTNAAADSAPACVSPPNAATETTTKTVVEEKAVKTNSTVAPAPKTLEDSLPLDNEPSRWGHIVPNLKKFLWALLKVIGAFLLFILLCLIGIFTYYWVKEVGWPKTKPWFTDTAIVAKETLKDVAKGPHGPDQSDQPAKGLIGSGSSEGGVKPSTTQQSPPPANPPTPPIHSKEKEKKERKPEMTHRQSLEKQRANDVTERRRALNKWIEAASTQSATRTPLKMLIESKADSEGRRYILVRSGTDKDWRQHPERITFPYGEIWAEEILPSLPPASYVGHWEYEKTTNGKNLTQESITIATNSPENAGLYKWSDKWVEGPTWTKRELETRLVAKTVLLYGVVFTGVPGRPRHKWTATLEMLNSDRKPIKGAADDVPLGTAYLAISPCPWSEILKRHPSIFEEAEREFRKMTD